MRRMHWRRCAAEQPDIIAQRLEMQWSKHYAALLAQLHVERT
ncbi:MAG TPA: hypothetical protein VE505_20675 [Vicinamibacterales bacterium]|nr:hypothetical protein [Vicinamibacterales bacterium]